MVDDAPDPTPGVPDSAGDTGVQQALGERRRRRLAERTGQVDLDATMSHWPVVEPPSTPRPVLRPGRPVVAGVATAPVLPPPGHLVVGPLLEARRAGQDTARRTTEPSDDVGRRSRRRGTAAATGPAGVADPAGVPDPGAAATEAEPVLDVPVATQDEGYAAEPDWEADLVQAAAPPGRVRRRPVAARPQPAAGGPSPQRPAPSGRGGPVPTPTGPPAGSHVPAGRGLSVPGGRRGVLVLVGVLLVVVLLVLLVVLVVGLVRAGDDAEAVTPPTDAPAQQTLAITLADADDGVAAAAILGVDAARVSTLLLPPDLLLTVADAGEVSLSQAAALGPDSVERGIEDTLGMRVDATVLLQPAQLATLVDGVGGVVVDVSQEVVTDDVVVTAREDQRLTGAQAVAYAGLSVEGEPTEARLARFGEVLTGVLTALPADAPAAGQTLDTAQVSAAPIDPAAGTSLAGILSSAADRAAAGNLEAAVLPTQVLSAGGAELRGVDDEAAQAELAGRFAGALLPVAAVGEVQVEVRNGVGTPGLASQARDRLVAAGLRYSGGGNAAEFGQPDTVVLVASQEAADRDQGEAVALALGLSTDVLQVNSQAMVDTDVVVVLGEDFAAAVTDAGPDPSTDPSADPTGDPP